MLQHKTEQGVSLACALIFRVHCNTSNLGLLHSGILRAKGPQSRGRDDSAVELYNEEPASQHIICDLLFFVPS